MNTTDVCAISASRRSRSCTRFVSTSSIVSYQQVLGGEFEVARADLFDVGEVLARHVGQRDVEDVEVLPRIRYSSRSSGPSKVSRNTSSASGGMYRSCGIANSGSPYNRATATPSIPAGSAVGAGPSPRGNRRPPQALRRRRPLRAAQRVLVW